MRLTTRSHISWLHKVSITLNNNQLVSPAQGWPLNLGHVQFSCGAHTRAVLATGDAPGMGTMRARSPRRLQLADKGIPTSGLAVAFQDHSKTNALVWYTVTKIIVTGARHVLFGPGLRQRTPKKHQGFANTSQTVPNIIPGPPISPI